MFERFTKDARAAVVSAQVVARDSRSESIDTRHVLVPLLEEPGPVARAVAATGLDPAAVAADVRAAIKAGDVLDGEALTVLGIDLDAVRERTDAVFGPGALDRAGRKRGKGSRGIVPFTSDAKKALELSLREAVRLKEKTIEPRHLMLGILRADSPGGRILERAGADLVALRTAVEAERPAA